ncbi:MAG: hypothetical protein ABEH65_01610 [Halobacteriales archaeon]
MDRTAAERPSALRPWVTGEQGGVVVVPTGCGEEDHSIAEDLMGEYRIPIAVVVLIGLVIFAGCSGTATRSAGTTNLSQDGDKRADTESDGSIPAVGGLPDVKIPIPARGDRPIRQLRAELRADGEQSTVEQRTLTELDRINDTYQEDVAEALLAHPELSEEHPLQLRLFRQVGPETKAKMLAVGLAGDYDRRVPPWLRVYIRSKTGQPSVSSDDWRIADDTEYSTLTSVNALEEWLWRDGTLSQTDIEGLVVFSQYVSERATFKNRTWSRYDQMRAVVDLGRKVADGTFGAATLQQIRDTDGDLLLNRWERVRSQTDPTTAHTDTDAFTDAEETFVLPSIVPAGEHPNATRPDVYVEVDYEAGLKPRLVDEKTLIDEFDTHGVTLHIVYDDELKELTRIHDRRKAHIAHRNADYSNKGFFYAILIDEETTLRNGQEEVVGVARGDSFVAKYNIRTFAHELGHVLGLNPSDFEGIDAHHRDEYQSIMRYEYGPVEYSDQAPFDDWAEMYDTGFTTSTAELRMRCSADSGC